MNVSDVIRVKEGNSAQICLVTVGNVSDYYDRSSTYITIYINVTSDTASESGELYYTLQPVISAVVLFSL